MAKIFIVLDGLKPIRIGKLNQEKTVHNQLKEGSLQGGPLPVRNGVITLINGLING